MIQGLKIIQLLKKITYLPLYKKVFSNRSNFIFNKIVNLIFFWTLNIDIKTIQFLFIKISQISKKKPLNIGYLFQK